MTQLHFFNRAANGVALRSLLALFLVVLAFESRGEPFGVSASFESAAAQRVSLKISVATNHFLYAATVGLQTQDGMALDVLEQTSAESLKDPFSGEMKDVYPSDYKGVYALPPASPDTPLFVTYQGCSQTICFLPVRKQLTLFPADAAAPSGESAAVDSVPTHDRFTVISSESGYMNAERFSAFLENGPGSATEGAAAFITNAFSSGAWLWGALLILTGGLALNLTPCVLPMIPINIAIIGAGSQAGSRARGFVLGSVYGAGIALVYGILGLVAVLTSSKFGALNSSPWFNASIASLFLVLSLSMFGLFNIDLTRFQQRQAGSGKKAGMALAFGMGCVAALLAGACVAPVLIAVLLLAGKLYTAGNGAGLFLPFLLGLGMALPWPFVGAGLSFLPKPGRWMEAVKIGFGILILAMSLYYGYESYRGFKGASHSVSSVGADFNLNENSGDDEWNAVFTRALNEQKPVLIDFWATWCKNCLAMEKTTLVHPDVKERLEDFIFVKYQAELPNASPAKEVLDRYGVLGLPTYIILDDVQKPSASQ